MEQSATYHLEVNEFTISEFTCGGCYEFALALQGQFGGSLFAEVDPANQGEFGIIHVWLQRDSNAQDVRGKFSGNYAQTLASLANPTIIPSPVFPIDKELYEWAQELIQFNKAFYA